jgi:DNA modification methylase
METAQITIRQGDCREVLPTLEAGSVQCCVSSPPYFGLRDYGTMAWEGGLEECEHSSVRRDHDDEKQRYPGLYMDNPSIKYFITQQQYEQLKEIGHSIVFIEVGEEYNQLLEQIGNQQLL